MCDLVCIKCNVSSKYYTNLPKDRPSCRYHSLNNNICSQCDNMNNSSCYHKWEYNIIYKIKKKAFLCKKLK